MGLFRTERGGDADTPLYLLNKETEVGYELPSRRDNYLPHQRRYI